MTGYVDPDRDNWQRFKDLPRDTPIQLLNLIRFRELAVYPDGHPMQGRGLAGREAFALYSRAFQDHVRLMGAAMVWEGRLECTITGPDGEWDHAFVMGFPGSATMMAMVKNPDYIRDIVPHRTAAVADSRLIRFAPSAG